MEQEKQPKVKGRRGKIIKTVLSGILAVILIILMVLANVVLPQFSKMANVFTGYNQKIDNRNIANPEADLNYYDLDFEEDEIAVAEKALNEQMSAEGTVLLKNDDKVMPFAKETEFSFFSANSNSKASFIASMMSDSGGSLKEGFESQGFKVNETLWDFYAEGAGKDYGLASGSISFGDAEDFKINEAPLALLKDEKVLDSVKDTVPVYVLSRVAGEGRDMPRSMYNHTDIEADKTKSYLEPDSVELEILNYLNDNYQDVVLLVKSNAALDLAWVDQFENINAVVYSQSMPGVLPQIFAGEINPSGRTVDTFAADALASPAAQNFGDYQYYNEAGEETVYNYVTYAEGIYIGYKYYETRYEDAVLKQGNAGDFNYQNEVVYPFGYGLSYTDFTWDNFTVSEVDGEFTATVDVTNTGEVSGRDVVELFAQSPYTTYDKENLVEKPAVKLVGYGKTKELAPKEKETITVTFKEEQLKAYDANKAKTFILEAGDYYFTAGRNAHDGLNNVLAAKGKTTVDGMTSEGDTKLVVKHEIKGEAVDSKTYATDSRSGKEITNLFDHAKSDVTYLTRNDWEGTFPTPDGEPSKVISTWGNEINGEKDGKPASFTRFKVASEELIGQLEGTDSLSPIDKETIDETPVYGAKNNLSLVEMRGLDFEDPQWNDLLDQLTPADYQTLIIDSGYGTYPIDSIDKPFNVDADTASGLIYGGTGAKYPVMMVLAQSWNQELALDYGTMVGNEALIGGADGWYAPSMNMHRTPFSGRNGEYYSEDEFLSGTVAANEVSGAASKGMYTFIKHYAVNDQENHRGDRDGQYGLATWSNEQAIREVYLLPFEMSIKIDDVEMKYMAKDADGNYQPATKKIAASQGIMTGFNRLGATWTGGSYPLITGILRNEWDFNGFIITDNANTSVFMDPSQMIESGADAKLLNAKDPTNYTFDEKDTVDYHYGRKAIHRMLYTIANSKAMNGAMAGSVFVQGMQFTGKVRLVVNLVSITLLALMGWFTYKRFKKATPKSE